MRILFSFLLLISHYPAQSMEPVLTVEQYETRISGIKKAAEEFVKKASANPNPAQAEVIRAHAKETARQLTEYIEKCRGHNRFASNIELTIRTLKEIYGQKYKNIRFVSAEPRDNLHVRYTVSVGWVEDLK